MFFVKYLPEFLYQPLKLLNVRPTDFANSKHDYFYNTFRKQFSDHHICCWMFISTQMSVQSTTSTIENFENLWNSNFNDEVFTTVG